MSESIIMILGSESSVILNIDICCDHTTPLSISLRGGPFELAGLSMNTDVGSFGSFNGGNSISLDSGSSGSGVVSLGSGSPNIRTLSEKGTG